MSFFHKAFKNKAGSRFVLLFQLRNTIESLIKTYLPVGDFQNVNITS